MLKKFLFPSQMSTLPEPQVTRPTADAVVFQQEEYCLSEDDPLTNVAPHPPTETASPLPVIKHLVMSEQMTFLVEGFQPDHLEEYYFENPTDLSLLEDLGFTVTDKVSEDQDAVELHLNHKFGIVVCPFSILLDLF